MKIYDYTSYKNFIADYVDFSKKSGTGITFSQLADSIQVQRSFLSQVLNGHQNLSRDQLFLLANKLTLSAEERRYLDVLLEIERCGVAERRAELVQERDSLRRNSLKTENSLKRKEEEVSRNDLSEYYSNPVYPMAHMFLLLPRAKHDPDWVCKRLGVSKKQYPHILGVLAKCGVIEATAQGIKVVKPTLHAGKESPLALMNGCNFRLKAIDKLQKKESEDDLFFTATFSATPAARLKVKRLFLAFLEEASRLIEASPSEEVFHLNFDLFEV